MIYIYLAVATFVFLISFQMLLSFVIKVTENCSVINLIIAIIVTSIVGFLLAVNGIFILDLLIRIRGSI